MARATLALALHIAGALRYGRQYSGEEATKIRDTLVHANPHAATEDGSPTPEMTVTYGGEMDLASVRGVENGQDASGHAGVHAIWVEDQRGNVVFLEEFGPGEVPRGGFAISKHLTFPNVRLTPFLLCDHGLHKGKTMTGPEMVAKNRDEL